MSARMDKCLVACLAAAALPGAAALRGRLAPLSGKVTQTLNNMEDLQYFGDITIGGQTIAGILDTGSFEFVTFSKRCDTCGIAGKYDETVSTTFKEGNLTQQHAYGSGECIATDGYDLVSMAGLTAKNQAVWISQQCQMPILSQAKFNAVVGIGPPGEPVLTAQQEVEYLMEEAENAKRVSGEAPKELTQSIARAKSALAIAKTKPALLENLGVTTFSECLGKAPGSQGMLVWNDEVPKGKSGVQKLRVLEDIFWGISSSDIAFSPQGGESAEVVACNGGCYAVVDTGTSLFAVPSNMYNQIFNALDSWMQTGLPADTPADCSDLSLFPDLVMTVDGQKLSFPPSSYIGAYVGFASKESERFIRTDRFKRNGCQLLLMDMGWEEMTPAGPTIILGMPFFREYYTTFDLGAGASSRSIFVSKAGDRCEQSAGGNAVVEHKERGEYAEREYAFRPRKVDASKLRVPKWLGRANFGRARGKGKGRA